jgi:hypothetical protein
VQDPPSLTTILDLALAQLREEGQARGKFEMRMTTAALELVKRAIALAPAYEAAETARLTALLDQGGDLDQLNRRLCALIRDGSLTLSSPGLAGHLRATTMEKLAIDQPTYAAYRRALDNSQG